MTIQTKFVILVAVLAFCGCLSSDTQQKEKLEARYHMAIKYADLSIATQAAHDMMVYFPAETSWRDTLVRLYFARKAFPQTILLAEEILETNPNDAKVMALVANAYRAVGNDKAALSQFESLYKNTGDIYHLYEVANVQYNLERVGECADTAKKLLAHQDIDSKMVELRFNNQNQSVPLKAAVINLQGVLAKDSGNRVEAEALFKQALQIFPGYLLARGNLDSLK
ncbi:MAG: hypothetical protein AAF502_17810 [Bacteroidota bacterium]